MVKYPQKIYSATSHSFASHCKGDRIPLCLSHATIYTYTYTQHIQSSITRINVYVYTYPEFIIAIFVWVRAQVGVVTDQLREGDREGHGG